MTDVFWDGKGPPRSGSESSLSGMADNALDLEAVGEDAKVCNNSMITLVHIFSIWVMKLFCFENFKSIINFLHFENTELFL